MCAFIALREGYEAISYECILRPTHTYSLFPGSSGLVYCGYLDGGGNREIVAIKTCKGILYNYANFSSISTKMYNSLFLINSSVTCK